MEGIESPKLVYVPSIAPSGMVLYRGKNYPKLNGKLLAGA
ncbi:PQQ-dependent oxidoreductase [Vibrio ishigakensis]|uniref:PQQ-dependent oxidoreductase n=3 Tax=Vibrio ishigakensis TaxID=1481914 RepID=A0A0B8PAS0_9VIBR|nr:PQQ-dependent oxidoreductase [Vibrio ishigakensis]